MKFSFLPKHESETVLSKSWAEVQQDAPLFQTEAAAALEQAVHVAALQEAMTPEVCFPIFAATMCKLDQASYFLFQ